MKQQISFITLGVKNLKVSGKFYTEMFGWQASEESNENIIIFKFKALRLALYPREKLAEDARLPSEGTGFPGFTLSCNQPSEKEVDRLFSSFRGKIDIVKEPEKVFWGGYSGYVKDPDGYLWEIAYNPFLET